MPRYFASILLLAFFVFTHAETTDELKRKLSTTSDTSTKLSLLHQLSELYLNQQPVQCLNYAQYKLNLARSNANKSAEADALALLGVANFKLNRATIAGEYIREAYTIAESIKNNEQMAFYQYWLGKLEETQGDYKKALSFYQSGIELSEKIGDKKNLVRCLDGKGSIFQALNDHDKARELFEQSLKLANDAGFNEWVPCELYSLAQLAIAKGDVTGAIALFHQSAELSGQVGNLNNKASCYQQLASIYFSKNDTHSAIKFTEKAMEIFQEIGAQSNYSYCQLLLSSILIRNGQTNYAIELAQQAYATGKKAKELNLEKQAVEILCNAYIQKGDKATALDYHIELSRLKDIISSKELSKKLMQMKMQEDLEKDKKIKEAEQAKRDAEAQLELKTKQLIRNACLITFVLLLIIGILALSVFLQKKKNIR